MPDDIFDLYKNLHIFEEKPNRNINKEPYANFEKMYTELLNNEKTEGYLPSLELKMTKQIYQPNLTQLIETPEEKNYSNIIKPISYLTKFNKEKEYCNENLQNNLINYFEEIEQYNIPQYQGILEHEALHDYLHPGDLNINILGSGPLTLTPSHYAEQSAEMAQRIAAMDKEITPAELNTVIRMLRIGPLITAVNTLAPVLSDKTKQPTRKLAEQVDRLMGVYQETVSEETPVGRMLDENIPEDRRVAIFDPASGDVVSLNQMLANGKACTAKFAGSVEDLVNSPASAFAQDSAAGGSVHFQFNGNSKSTSYNRIHLAQDKKGRTIAFYDCIESGNMGRTNVESYTSQGIEDVLLGSFASSMIVANRLGLERISFGDLEMVDVARQLGFGERAVFNGDKNHEQKLGHVGGTTHSNGPYCWTMGRDKNFRTVDPRLYQPEVLHMVVGQMYQVMKRVDSNRKSLKRLRDNYEQFFGFVNQIFEETRDVLGEDLLTWLRYDLHRFADKYDLNLGPGDAEPVIPEAVEPVEAPLAA